MKVKVHLPPLPPLCDGSLLLLQQMKVPGVPLLVSLNIFPAACWQFTKQGLNEAFLLAAVVTLHLQEDLMVVIVPASRVSSTTNKKFL